jgi:hypothetical protein
VQGFVLAGHCQEVFHFVLGVRIKTGDVVGLAVSRNKCNT